MLQPIGVDHGHPLLEISGVVEAVGVEEVGRAAGDGGVFNFIR